MIDQATALRKLVLQAMRENTVAAGPPPRLILCISGRDEVGVTTLAVNVSIALAELGARTVVVDADLYRPGVAALCGLSDQQSLVDMLIARRDIHEVLQRGPAGIQIVPGLWRPGETVDWSEMAQERLLRQFRTLGRHADIVVLDAGVGTNDFLRRCCRAANDVMLVTTPDTASVMDAYARIKSTMAGVTGANLRLVVNECDELPQAEDVHRRIDQSCDRFLGVRLSLIGHVPHDGQVPLAGGQTTPFVVGSPDCPAARAVQQLALRLSQAEHAQGATNLAG